MYVSVCARGQLLMGGILADEKSLSFAVRTRITGRACTTNEGKRGGLVFHHEQAQTPWWPSRVFFYCEKPAPDGGGATGVSPSDALLRRLEERYPDFVKDCEAKGVKYSAYMSETQVCFDFSGRGTCTRCNCSVS